MEVSNIEFYLKSADEPQLRGASARTRKLILAKAIEVMQEGRVPSVSELAEFAEVSRATGYRYFPTQSDLVTAVIREMLQPILSWTSDLTDPGDRIEDLFRAAFPLLDRFVATSRAALRHSLDPKLEPSELDAHSLQRGFRIALIKRALGDLDQRLDDARYECLVSGLAMVFGVEAQVVQSDICGHSEQKAHEICIWAARALIESAIRDEELPNGS